MDAQIKLLIQEVKLHCYARIKDELESVRKSPYDDDYVEVIEYPYKIVDDPITETDASEEPNAKEKPSGNEIRRGGSPLTDFDEPNDEPEDVQISIQEAIQRVETIQKHDSMQVIETQPCADEPALSLKAQYRYERKLANLRINKRTQRAHDRVAGYQSVIKYLDELLEKYEAESTSYDI